MVNMELDKKDIFLVLITLIGKFVDSMKLADIYIISNLQ